MKMGKAPMFLKKATAMCKSKTGLLSDSLLVLATLQRRRMATVAMISHKIHKLVVADRERVDCHKALEVLHKVDKRPAVAHGGVIAADLSHQLAMFDQEDGHGGFPDWTIMHPLFSDEEDSCRYTDDGDVMLDTCHDDDEPSVMDVIRRTREVEGLEFNMEDEIDQAADMFILRFRQQMNKDFKVLHACTLSFVPPRCCPL